MRQMMMKFAQFVMIFLPLAALGEAASPQQQAIEARLSGNGVNGGPSVAGETIYAHDLITRLYRLNTHHPLWSADNTKKLIGAIEAIEQDGLIPEDYLFPKLREYVQAGGNLSPEQKIDLDILLSEAMVRSLYNLYFGKVDAERLDPDINFTRPLGEEDRAPEIHGFINNGKIAVLFDQMRPANPRYRQLQDGLALYRQYQEAGGWQPLEDGKTLKPGQSDARVVGLRQRLRITGDYPQDAAEPLQAELFDPTLTEAVERFQRRQGLDVDGAVGAKTLAALNMPVEARIDRIRVNLERMRWIMHEAYDEFLLVNIAAFEVYWVKDNEVIWEEKVQVGKHYAKTPVFKDKICEVTNDMGLGGIR